MSRRSRAHGDPFIRAALDLRAECRAAYGDALEAAVSAAEAATRGHMLNAHGRAAGVSAASLFMGPAARAHAYASAELLEWWSVNPRVTFAEFAQQWQQPQRYALGLALDGGWTA